MKFTKHGGARSGFTLPEVLVTIALVAALAAVVVPTVATQLQKGDPNRVASDYAGVRGAVEQFLSDVRKYPRSLGQMTNPIATTGTGMSPANSATLYGATDVARWRGPYLTKDSLSVALTGFGYSMKLDTVTLKSDAAGTATTNYTCTTPCTGGIKYLILSVGGGTSTMDTLAWLALDKAVDDGVALTGSIRYKSGTDTIKMLVMPIQP